MKLHKKECPECEGRGWATYEKTTKNGYEEYNADCDNCDGSGEIVDDEYEEGLGDWLMHKRQDEEYDNA